MWENMSMALVGKQWEGDSTHVDVFHGDSVGYPMVPPLPPLPHHRIRTNNQGEFHGSGLIPTGTPIGKRTHGVTWLSAQCSYPGRNPCPWRDPYRGIHKGGRPPKAAAPLCGGGRRPPPLYDGLGGGKHSKNIQTYQQICIEYVY